MKPVEYEEVRNSDKRFWGMSEGFKLLRRLHKIRFSVKHRGKVSDTKTYQVLRFVWDLDKYGPEGANANNVRFELDGKQICVKDYFLKKYNIYLAHPRLPLIETTRAGFYPMEICIVEDMQRYNFKLDPSQVCTFPPHT